MHLSRVNRGTANLQLQVRAHFANQLRAARQVGTDNPDAEDADHTVRVSAGLFS